MILLLMMTDFEMTNAKEIIFQKKILSLLYPAAPASSDPIIPIGTVYPVSIGCRLKSPVKWQIHLSYFNNSRSFSFLRKNL
jgi:hypothetical protein